MKSSLITIGIPTKNRELQLLELLNSLSKQSFQDFTVLIVDQSKNSAINVLKKEFIHNLNFFNKIEYIHKTSINSLTQAKNFIIKNSDSRYICFLEDDEVLFENFIKNLYQGFKDNCNMIGSSGTIVNHPINSFVYKFFFNFFHIGIFKDNRVNIYANSKTKNFGLILSNKISGGLTMWKSWIFNEFSFDDLNNIHFTEDIDFSTRVYDKYPSTLFINLSAKLYHNINQNKSTRLLNFELIEKKVYEYKIFYRKRKNFLNLLCTVWLFIGFFLESLYYCLRNKNLKPLTFYFKGLFSNGA